MSPDPFLLPTDLPFVALSGKRNGYLQLAPAYGITQYRDLSPELFAAALGWAQLLEAAGAKRVYWITLSEVVRHLHIHLYPRWPEDTLQGLALFEQREQVHQPSWTPALIAQRAQWAETFGVYLPQAGSVV